MTWWWTQLLLKFTLIGTVILCRFHRPPRAPTAFDNFTHTLIFVSTFWSVWSRIAEIATGYLDFATLTSRMEIVLVNNVNMAVTLLAFVWLVLRSWQTLSTPVPVLIKTLHVEVPEAPDVSLSGIRSDSATLQWARPSQTRTVLRFLIQVNGVNVGESAAQETAITVTGLKPGHFYNIRVIAVGLNNFQVSSPVIRLQTYDINGRPIMADEQLPASFREQDARSRVASGADRNKSTTTASEGPSDSTPANAHASTAQRRNTINRKTSPSVTSSDQPALKDIIDKADVSLQDLNDKFERTRREIEETAQQYSREEDDFKQQEADLKSELAEKKRLNKERDAKTEQLRKQMRTAMELKRAADKEKAKKEQILKDKESKLEAIHISIAKLGTSIKDMQSKRKTFEEDTKALDEDYMKKTTKLDADNAKLAEECAALEASLKQKGKHVKAMKLERHKLSVSEDGDVTNEAHAKVVAEKEATKRELENRIKSLTTQGHELEVQYQNIRLQNENLSLHHHQLQQGSMAGYYGQPNANMGPVTSTSTEFDRQIPISNQQATLRNRHGSNNISESPSMQFPIVDTSYNVSGFQQNASFPYIDMPPTTENYASDDGFTPIEYRHAPSGPPLSPTATSLLPSGILGDFNDISDGERGSPLPTNVTVPSALAATPPIADAQSPTVSDPSPSLLSSPHGSSGNLPFPTLGPETPDRSKVQGLRESAPVNGPAMNQHQHQRFTSLFSFPKHHTRPSVEDADLGMPFGSLRPSQSQSLPRQNDGPPPLDHDKRTGFSLLSRNTIHTDSSDVFGAVGSSRVPTRMHNPFSTSGSLILGSMHERDPSSPRPSSIASAELPRPSTDSGSPWGSGDPTAGFSKNRPWPTESRWHHARSASRRTSIHGVNINANPSNGGGAFFATEDDDILDERELQKLPAHRVGVIGSRPPNAQSISSASVARLNPNAPTFMASAFQPDGEGEQSDGRNWVRDNKGHTMTEDYGQSPPSRFIASSPQGYYGDDPFGKSTKRRETISANSQNLASASSSHEMLSLALESSSEGHQDNSLMKLFRKGSSSRFSLSSRLSKETGSLFKKGPGSTSATSDRKASLDARSSLSLGDGADGYDESLLASPTATATTTGHAGDVKDREKEGRMTSWRFSMSKKKDKAAAASTRKENVDLDRDRERGTETEMPGGSTADYE
ncbi:uncharacterized protein BROUX77_001045 [Berkeleyomyces rouxiae]|uniref:uncharacterized protein n=1 Tax=Berkeleyomyces rouxiae TaxID=2035830 RepID=UPI003B819356